MTNLVLVAAVTALIGSLVPLLKWVREVTRTKLTGQSQVTVKVERWDGSKVTLDIQPDSEESITQFLEELKAIRFGEKIVPPEAPKEERRAASAEAAY